MLSTSVCSISSLANLRINALSFSKLFANSSGVVAPIVSRLPFPSIGLIILAISTLLLPALPAPIIICISSINKIALGDSSSISRTVFNRSSKSPLYFVPASKSPTARLYTTLFLITSGTSPSTIRLARPSAIAVLPTPGSPTRTQLFFLRLARICTKSLTSVARPINSSILPSTAC